MRSRLPLLLLVLAAIVLRALAPAAVGRLPEDAVFDTVWIGRQGAYFAWRDRWGQRHAVWLTRAQWEARCPVAEE